MRNQKILSPVLHKKHLGDSFSSPATKSKLKPFIQHLFLKDIHFYHLSEFTKYSCYQVICRIISKTGKLKLLETFRQLYWYFPDEEMSLRSSLRDCQHFAGKCYYLLNSTLSIHLLRSIYFLKQNAAIPAIRFALFILNHCKRCIQKN